MKAELATVLTSFWDGYGGSIVVCGLDARVAFSYVMNRMDAGVHGDDRGTGLWRAVYESLGRTLGSRGTPSNVCAGLERINSDTTFVSSRIMSRAVQSKDGARASRPAAATPSPRR